MEKGITRSMDGAAVKFTFGWGWAAINPTSGAVDVYGPGVGEWFDAEKACQSACTMMRFAPRKCDEFDMVAQAINLQYAAWKGMRGLMRRTA